MGLNLHFYAFSKEVIQSKHVNPHLEILVNEKKPNVSSSNASTVSGLNVSLSCFSFDDFPAFLFSSSLSLFSLVFLFLLYCTRGGNPFLSIITFDVPCKHTYVPMQRWCALGDSVRFSFGPLITAPCCNQYNYSDKMKVYRAADRGLAISG